MALLDTDNLPSKVSGQEQFPLQKCILNIYELCTNFYKVGGEKKLKT